jgi:iron complex transport system substrate-binding protein
MKEERVMKRKKRERLSAPAGFLCCLLFAAVSCSGSQGEIITDRTGNKVRVPGKIERIISTAPSNTEMLVDLGLADLLVAVDRYSAAIPGVPPDIPQIDFFNPDGETVMTLRPDVIIANGHNETGAGTDPFRLIWEAGIAVVYIPLSAGVDAICDDLRFLAGLFGAQDRGETLAADFRAQVDEIAQVGRTITDRKRVYFEISPPPIVATVGGDTFLGEMVSLIGADNIFAGRDGIVFPIDEMIVERNPQVIITNIVGPDPAREILQRNGFAHVSAVEQGRVYWVDTDSSSRPSPHIVLALRQMAQAVYPEYYEKQD